MTKKIFILIAIVLSIQFSSFSQVPFHRGVNLTQWFQKPDVHQMQFTKFTEQDIINIKSLGCDVIRLPINLHFMTDGEPNYTIDPLFFYFLDQVVEWAEEHQVHLILDNHTFDPAEVTDPGIGNILTKVWPQIAEQYKDSYEYLYYEILNEPHGIDDYIWGQIQGAVIDTIRTIDSIHTLIVGPASWNSYNNLQYIPEYTDTNLIYTFHFYDPFLFTHQGASWTDPSMEPLSDVPFPYDAEEMPALPESLKGSWLESAYNNYPLDGTVAKVKTLIDIAVDFRDTRNVPIFCGEFGVYIPNSNNDDRTYWYRELISYLDEKNIPWTMWDYTGGFGLFEEGSNNLFEYDLNIPLIDSMGLIVPEQKEFVILPDSTGFPVYKDYIMENIIKSSWFTNGQLDYYHEDTRTGNFSIYWTGVAQYNHIGFQFKPVKDLSFLALNGYALNSWVRGTSPGAQFDFRFVDTKTDDPDDHPWRIRYTIDESDVPWDGEWHHLYIPLSTFTEQGSWDSIWYNPIGAFDWTRIKSFEIVAEHHDLYGIEFWFDDIEISDVETSIKPDIISNPQDHYLKIYPNPFYQNSEINYRILNSGLVNISIYNLAGQKIKTLFDQFQHEGNYSVTWDGTDAKGNAVQNGIYLCNLVSRNKSFTTKIVVLR